MADHSFSTHDHDNGYRSGADPPITTYLRPTISGLSSDIYSIPSDVKGCLTIPYVDARDSIFTKCRGRSSVPNIIAVKCFRLRGKTGIDGEIAKSLSREAMGWEQLDHPNVLPFLGIGNYAEGRLATVTPWMKHGNIMEYLRQYFTPNRPELVSNIASGLAFLHSNGIIHGNLHTGNILISDNGEACVVDYGLAYILEPSDQQVPFGMAQGSARWMAPELLHDGKLRATSASDIYSYASVCYEIFTEDRPYSNIPSEFDVILAVFNHEQPSRPSMNHPAFSRGLDDRIWALMEQCWSASVDERPTASTLCNSLATIISCSHKIEASKGDGQVETCGGINQITTVSIESSAANFVKVDNLTLRELSPSHI